MLIAMTISGYLAYKITWSS